MNKIIRVYKEQVPAMRFIGKKYIGEEGFAHWGDFFANGWFDTIEAAMGGTRSILDIWENGGGYAGMELRRDGALLEYWIGMFAPQDTAVPQGFDSMDFGPGNLGVCWNYGKENEVHDVGENEQAVLREGMELWADGEGRTVRFENGLCPRFTTPDENGNVILDYCFYVK